MAQVPIGLAVHNPAEVPSGARLNLTPGLLRTIMFAASAAAASLAWFATRGDAAIPDAELTRVLQFMTLAKAMIGVGALWLVSIRFRYRMAPRLAFGYIAGGAIMAAGPGAMWATAHIILGSLLFYAGLAVIIAIGAIDGGFRYETRGRRT